MTVLPPPAQLDVYDCFGPGASAGLATAGVSEVRYTFALLRRIELEPPGVTRMDQSDCGHSQNAIRPRSLLFECSEADRSRREK